MEQHSGRGLCPLRESIDQITRQNRSQRRHTRRSTQRQREQRSDRGLLENRHQGGKIRSHMGLRHIGPHRFGHFSPLYYRILDCKHNSFKNEIFL